MTQILRHHSGRMIAVSRIALTLLFVMWVWLDPDQPVRGGLVGYWFLFGYAFIATLLTIAGWRDWWADYLLFVPALLVDSLFLLAALYFTQSRDTDLVSPFIAFFAFIVLSASIRRNWIFGLSVALLLCLGFLVVGFSLTSFGLDVDFSRFVRRSSFMMAMALIFVWFAKERKTGLTERLEFQGIDEHTNPFEQALAYASRELGAGGVALAWTWSDEQSVKVFLFGSLKEKLVDCAASLSRDMSHLRPQLFDFRRRRVLAMRGDEVLRAARTTPDFELPGCLGINDGLSVPIDGVTGSGQFVAVGIAGMGVDHLAVGAAIGREVARALDRDQFASTMRDALVTRIRADVARDLHDSVAQSLAGTRFRLASLRNIIDSGKDPIPELDQINASIGIEQAHVRQVIDRLRQRDITPGKRNLVAELSLLLQGLSAQWGIEANISDAAKTAMIPIWLGFELQQIVREAVANAVRHGSASAVTLAIEASPQELILTIKDNGVGFAASTMPARPASIDERVAALRGVLEIHSEPQATCLTITLRGGHFT